MPFGMQWYRYFKEANDTTQNTKQEEKQDTSQEKTEPTQDKTEQKDEQAEENDSKAEDSGDHEAQDQIRNYIIYPTVKKSNAAEIVKQICSRQPISGTA